MRRVNISDPNFTYDPEDPEGFRAGMFRLGPDLGAEDTGTTVYELPPGRGPLSLPLRVRRGGVAARARRAGRFLRTPEGTEQLDRLDVVFFPHGPEGAHQIGTDRRAGRVLMWSTVVYPSATSYPDSDKVGVWTGRPRT